MSSTDLLAPRAAPKQARSRQTFDHILDVTAELIASVGVDAFNTNLLAQRAGIGPRAIYRYFPNKWAVLKALSERFRQLEADWMGDLTQFAVTPDWRALLDQSIRRYYAAAREAKGFAALRAASRASPELRAFEDEANAEVELQLARGFAGVGLGLDEKRLLALCRVIIETINRVLDSCLNVTEREAKPMLDDLCVMVEGLVAHHADAAARAGTPTP